MAGNHRQLLPHHSLAELKAALDGMHDDPGRGKTGVDADEPASQAPP
jgi:hypothetical protein